MALLPAYQRVTFRGVTLNRRTVAMIKAAEKICGFSLAITQGSYNPGGVADSGTTHAGGGSVDWRSWNLTDAQRRVAVRALKAVGFAVWFRDTDDGFDPHIHGIAIDDREASAAAKWQVSEFLKGRSGLSSGRADPTWRPDPAVRWSYLLGRPVRLKP